MAYTTRALSSADLGQSARFFAAYEKIEDSGEVWSEADISMIMALPAIDVANNSRGIFDGDQLVAVGLVLPDFMAREDSTGGEQLLRLQWVGKVGYDRQGHGLGTELLDWATSRASVLADSAQFRIRTRIRTSNAAANALLSASGFTPVRWYFGMRKPLTTTENRARLAERAATQLRLVPFTQDFSLATLECHNTAFADAWESPRAEPDVWETMVIGNPQFRADLSFVFLDEQDRVVSLLLGYHNEAKFAETGQREVLFAPIATLREWRGQGLAGALMQASGNRAFELGFAAAILEVDSENPTGALGVYRKAGFEVTRDFVTYELTATGTRQA
jgi:mycothiol synthase